MLREDIESMLDWAEYTSSCSCKIDGDWIRIITETKAIWSINIEDYRRFRTYTLFHKPLGREGAHVQRKDDRLLFLIWTAISHDFYKYELHERWTSEDYNRWLSDYLFMKRSGFI